MNAVKTAKWVLLIDQSIVSGGTLVTQLLIAAHLGVVQYGRYSVLVLVQLFFLSIQQAGLTGMYQVTYPGMDRRLCKQYTAGIWAAELLFLATIMLLSLLAYPAFRALCPFMEWIVCLFNVVLFLLQDFFRRIFITGNQIRSLVIIDLINNLLQAGALILLLPASRSNLTLALWVCALSFIPGLLWALLRQAPSPSFQKIKYVFKHNGTEAVWMTASALLQWFAGNFYIVAAGWWLGAATLGILRLGQYIFGLLNVLLQALESYLLPRAAARATIPGEAIRYLKTVQYKMMLGAGLLLLVVAMFSKPLISMMHIAYPDELTIVLYGMSLLYFFVVGGYPVRIALRTLKLSRFFFIGYVLTACFGFSSAYLFIHQWSLTGVMAGLLCSQLLPLCYWVYILQHKYYVLWR